MLQSNSGIGNLSLLSHATKLPAKFGALSQASCSKWVTLGDEASTWVDDAAGTAISEVITVDCLTCLSFLTKAKGFVCNKLISAKAVVKLDNIDLVRSDSGHLVSFLSGSLCHAASDQINRGAAKRVELVCRQADANQLDRLVLKAMADHELFRTEDSGGCSISVRAASEKLDR